MLALHCNQQWEGAMRMTPSDANALFKSDAFVQWQKWRESQQALLVASIDRQNSVIKALNNLAKIMAR